MAKLKAIGIPLVLGIGAIGVLVGLYFLLSQLISTRDIVGMLLFVSVVIVASFFVGTRVLFAALKELERKVEEQSLHIKFLQTEMSAGFNYQRNLDLARIKNKIGGGRPSIDQLLQEKETWHSYTDSAGSSAPEKTQ